MQQLLAARADIRPIPSPPSPSSPSSGPISSTPRERSTSTFACVAGWFHIRVFIAGARRTGPSWASAASVTRVSAIPTASFASVLAVSGATTSKSALSRWGYGSALGERRAKA
jgi:hypothetical protein